LIRSMSTFQLSPPRVVVTVSVDSEPTGQAVSLRVTATGSGAAASTRRSSGRTGPGSPGPAAHRCGRQAVVPLAVFPSTNVTTAVAVTQPTPVSRRSLYAWSTWARRKEVRVPSAGRDAPIVTVAWVGSLNVCPAGSKRAHAP